MTLLEAPQTITLIASIIALVGSLLTILWGTRLDLVAFGAASYAFGQVALKMDPVVGVLATILGLAIGHYIDQEVSKRCPQCGALLQIAGLLP